MFHEEFYPTPKPVIEKMLSPFAHRGNIRQYGLNLRGRVLLEPHGGKGDILDYLSENTSLSRDQLYCCEINPDLQSLLRGKGYALIGEDFLELDNMLYFDFIIMNPPFSNGDEHLLHAWNMIDSGDVVCLLNSETLRNPNTKRRKLLAQIIKDHGTAEELGKVFRTAERKTDVEVTLVRLHKASTGDKFKFFENTEHEKSYELNEESLGNQIARRDVIGNMVTQYEEVKSIFAEYMRLHSKLRFFLGPLIPNSYYSIDKVIEEALKMEVGAKGYSLFVSSLNSMAWKTVIGKTNMRNYMTRQVSNDFEAWSKSQGMMAFTEKNIHALIEMIFLNQTTILEKCLVEAFDLMCRYDKDNTTHWEGWLTNDAYKVNRKVIMPYFCEFSIWGMRVTRQDTLNDIDRALCLLTGKKFVDICGDEKNPDMSVAGALGDHFKNNSVSSGPLTNNVVDTEHFTVKYFKKGTIHMVFKDEKLWERFNLAAAKGKNWLPDESTKGKKKRGVAVV